MLTFYCIPCLFFDVCLIIWGGINCNQFVDFLMRFSYDGWVLTIFKKCSGWLETSLLNKNGSYIKLKSFSGYFQQKQKLLIENCPNDTLQLWVWVPGTSALLLASLRPLNPSSVAFSSWCLRLSCSTKACLVPKSAFKNAVNLSSQAPQTSYLSADNDIILK